ncbi:hypothetical protein [Salinigranum salinum]|uniref:hypothetical protein n=1 Tax=Salinigranum salinum TaxID=1364937 RepID=UPI001260E1B7|nr:hypothetical protein [Salinigranum salinum]
MSNSSSPVSRERLTRVREVAQSQSLQHGARLVAAPLRFVGFWAAVALPFLYLPLLISGLDGQETLVFGLLLALNAVALVIGHGHGQ